jgi:hypothetical protein
MIVLSVNSVAAESASSTTPIPKPAIGYDPEPVSSTSDPQNLSSKDPSECYCPIFSVFKVDAF